MVKYKFKTSEKLMAKYSGRERNKVEDACYKVSEAMVEFCEWDYF